MNRIWLNLLCIASVSPPIVFFLVAVKARGIASAEAAAWAQAVFTVVAVFVTGQLALLPVMEERDRRYRDRKAFLSALGDAYILAANRAAALRAAVKDRDLSRLRQAQHITLGEADHTFKRMLDMPLTAWPDPLFYEGAWRYHRTLVIYLNACEEGGGPDEKDWLGLSEWGDAYAAAERAFDSSLAGYMRRLDAERDSAFGRLSRWLDEQRHHRAHRRALKAQAKDKPAAKAASG